MLEEAAKWDWGDWWLPGAEERAPGRLSFDESEGAHLTMRGALAGAVGANWSWPALLGQAHDGEALTLLNPVVLSQSTGVGDHGASTRTELRASVLVRGAHVESHEEFKIKKASVRFRGLRDLCFARAQRGGQTNRFIEPQQGSHQLVGVPGATLNFTYVQFKAYARFLHSTEDDVAVVIDTDEALPLREFQARFLLPLQALVTLAVRDPSLIESLTVVVPTEADVHPAISHGSPQIRWDEDQIDVLMRLPGLTAEPRYDYTRPLVPFAAVEGGIADFISNWWSLYEQLGSAIAFLVNALGSRMFLENRLLNEMGFAESYHRTRHGAAPITKSNHRNLVSAMLKGIPEKHRDHYRARLAHGNEETQRERLEWLIARAAEVLHTLDGLQPGLAADLVKTRNALTHLDPTAAPSALRDEPLYRAVELLEVALRANILVDLGISPEQTRGLMEASYYGQTPFVSIT